MDLSRLPETTHSPGCVSLREEGVDLSLLGLLCRPRHRVSLREEGVDLSPARSQSHPSRYVSLREEGVDLSPIKSLFVISLNVSLREEGVDLSLGVTDLLALKKRLPPRGGSGFKQTHQ